MNLLELMISNKTAKKFVSFQFFLFVNFILFFLNGCGLPQYETIEKPIAGTPNGNIVYFTTPADTSITGYALYYKIYDPDEITLIASDEALFDPDNYDSSLGQSIPTGNSLLISNNFKSMTKNGYNLFTSPLLPLTGGGDTVEINFTDTDSLPKLLVNSSQQMELKRGSKGSTTSKDSDSGEPFFSFIGQVYDISTPLIDNDLSNMMSSSRMGGNLSGTTIKISICAYSVGVNVTTMSKMVSEPVFLGTFAYGPVETTAHD